jgi:hypothetical protein
LAVAAVDGAGVDACGQNRGRDGCCGEGAAACSATSTTAATTEGTTAAGAAAPAEVPAARAATRAAARGRGVRILAGRIVHAVAGKVPGSPDATRA